MCASLRVVVAPTTCSTGYHAIKKNRKSSARCKIHVVVTVTYGRLTRKSNGSFASTIDFCARASSFSKEAGERVPLCTRPFLVTDVFFSDKRSQRLPTSTPRATSLPYASNSISRLSPTTCNHIITQTHPQISLAFWGKCWCLWNKTKHAIFRVGAPQREPAIDRRKDALTPAFTYTCLFRKHGPTSFRRHHLPATRFEQKKS